MRADIFKLIATIVFDVTVCIAVLYQNHITSQIVGVVEIQETRTTETAKALLRVDQREQRLTAQNEYEDRLRQAAIEELQARVRKLEENGKLICD